MSISCIPIKRRTQTISTTFACSWKSQSSTPSTSSITWTHAWRQTFWLSLVKASAKKCETWTFLTSLRITSISRDCPLRFLTSSSTQTSASRHAFFQTWSLCYSRIWWRSIESITRTLRSCSSDSPAWARVTHRKRLSCIRTSST